MLYVISFTNPFVHSLSGSFPTAFMDLNLYWTKWALAFVCFSFFFIHFSGYVCYIDLSRSHSAFESTLNSSIVSYPMYKWLSGRVNPDSLVNHRQQPFTLLLRSRPTRISMESKSSTDQLRRRRIFGAPPPSHLMSIFSTQHSVTEF